MTSVANRLRSINATSKLSWKTYTKQEGIPFEFTGPFLDFLPKFQSEDMDYNQCHFAIAVSEISPLNAIMEKCWPMVDREGGERYYSCLILDPDTMQQDYAKIKGKLKEYRKTDAGRALIESFQSALPDGTFRVKGLVKSYNMPGSDSKPTTRGIYFEVTDIQPSA